MCAILAFRELFPDSLFLSRPNSTDQRRLLRRTTSLVVSPRVSSSVLPSRVQLKLKISPEVNFVSCLGGPPTSGCSQIFEAPSFIRMYWRPFPSGDQRHILLFCETLRFFTGGPPSTAITARLQPCEGTWPYWV